MMIAVEFVETFRRIGLEIRVSGRGHREPLPGTLLVAPLEKGIGIGVIDTGTPRTRRGVCRLLQRQDRRIKLAQVAPDPGDDNGQLGLFGRAELGCLGA